MSMEVPGTRCRLRPSRHAADRMIGQGLGWLEVLTAVQLGAKRRQGDRIIATYAGKEAVFVKRPCRYFLVTAYWLGRSA